MFFKHHYKQPQDANLQCAATEVQTKIAQYVFQTTPGCQSSLSQKCVQKPRQGDEKKNEIEKSSFNILFGIC